MIGCLRTRVRKQPIIELYFESENEAKFYKPRGLVCTQRREMEPNSSVLPGLIHEAELAYLKSEYEKYHIFGVGSRLFWSAAHTSWPI